MAKQWDPTANVHKTRPPKPTTAEFTQADRERLVLHRAWAFYHKYAYRDWGYLGAPEWRAFTDAIHTQQDEAILRTVADLVTEWQGREGLTDILWDGLCQAVREAGLVGDPEVLSCP